MDLSTDQTVNWARPGIRYAAGAFLCLITAAVCGYLNLTHSIVIRSSVNVEDSKYVNSLLLRASLPYWGDKPGRYGFDGFIWIGSRTTPRISIDTSAAVAQIRIGHRFIEPSCHALDNAGGHPNPIAPTIRCDVDLSGFPRNSVQSLAIMLSSSGSFMLNLEPALHSPIALFFGGAALIAVSLFVLFFCRAADQSWKISAICAFGLGVRLVYWCKTPPGVRAHDPYGHLEYIAFVAQNWVRPDRNAGWETTQAPLYYYVGAGLESLERHFGLTGVGLTPTSVQGLSLVFSILTAVVALFCFREFARLFCVEAAQSERAVTTAFALYVFWPTVVIDSVRIGNDSLLLLWAAIFLLCILRWHSYKDPRALLAASVAFAFAIVTKASAVLLLPVLALAAGLEWRAWLNKRTVYKQLFWLAPLLVVACLVTFGGGIRERISGSNTSLFIGHKQYLGASLAVGNRPSNYLLFSPKQFIQLPFTDLYDDRYGRQMFWHYFWKTSLFGETNRGGRFESLCASVLSGLLLLFFILASLNLRFFRDAKRRKSLVSVFAFAAVWIVGTVAYSVLYPFSADRDFRFAAPALIVICWLTALSASSFASRRWLSLAMFASALVLLFIGGSIGFVLRLDSFR